MSPAAVDGLVLFSERMAKASRLTDKDEAVVNISRFLGCDVTGGDSNCTGISRADLDRAGVAIADIYAPDWKERAQQTAFATTDRNEKNTALFFDSRKEHAEQVLKPHFGPAFETYIELRKILRSHKDLLGIATNYVDPKTGSAAALSYRTLPLSAAELVGMKLDVDAKGNVLLTHPGKDKNRNFTLDGHRGSVLTFGGIPLLPFDPTSIDQSDATSVMPIPKTATKASRSSPEPAADTKSKTTVGEGKSDTGC